MELKEDYYSYAFVSEFTIFHVLVVIFQTERKEKISTKKLELEAAKSNHEDAKVALE